MSQIKSVRKSVQWQDLRLLTKWQVLYNVLLPYPFLGLAWWSAWKFSSNHSFILAIMALVGWFLFFAGSFRQAHDGFHRVLGLNKMATDCLLLWSSALIMSSNHAVRQTHLQHHRNPLADDDLEAEFHKLTWWQAILGGFGFYMKLHKRGWELAKHKEKQKILMDLGLMGLVIALAIILSSTGFYILLVHILVMVFGNSFVGFVAGWCVHHDCHAEDGKIIARTERNKLINLLTFNLLHHQEHHLFPAVPTSNLPELAKRLDEVAPEMVSLRVVPNFGKVVESKILNSQQEASLQLKKEVSKI